MASDIPLRPHLTQLIPPFAFTMIGNRQPVPIKSGAGVVVFEVETDMGSALWPQAPLGIERDRNGCFPGLAVAPLRPRHSPPKPNLHLSTARIRSDGVGDAFDHIINWPPARWGPCSGSVGSGDPVTARSNRSACLELSARRIGVVLSAQVSVARRVGLPAVRLKSMPKPKVQEAFYCLR